MSRGRTAERPAPRLDARAATSSGLNRCALVGVMAGLSGVASQATRSTLLRDRDPFRRRRALEQARSATLSVSAEGWVSDEQHAESEYKTAWYVDEQGRIRAQMTPTPKPRAYRLGLRVDPVVYTPTSPATARRASDAVVASWNDSHSAPGAPLVEDAGETGAFLDAADTKGETAE